MSYNREMPKVLNKVPLALKLVLGGLPILAAALYSYYSTQNNMQNKKQFFDQGFSSVVIASRISEGRTTEFQLKNGLKVYFWLSAKNTLLTGDSIRKDAHTYIYDIYRKGNDGNYRFLATYNFEEMD